MDNAGQTDTSTSGATARYRIYPGDVAPTLTEALLSPSEDTTFTDGRIFVSGRAEDDKAMQAAQVAIMNSANQYMNSSGAFTSTTPSWRTAFLTSPGTPGSNFSYTSPVVPPGTYTVSIQGIDNHDQVTTPPAVRHVTVTAPAGQHRSGGEVHLKCPATRQPATATNVCEFDGRTSTDENAPTLTYAWTYTCGDEHQHQQRAEADPHVHRRAGDLHGEAGRDRRVGHRQCSGDAGHDDHRAGEQRTRPRP